MKKSEIILAAFCFAVMFASCGGSMDLGSKWADEPVPIDGTADQWKGKTTYIKDGGLLFGVQNDSNYIYVALTTSDPGSKSQILMRGLTVWFDTQGGDNKNFGVKYPIGAREMGMMNMPRKQDDNNGTNQDWMQQMEDNMLNSTTLEVMNSDDDGNKMEMSDASGISVKLSRSNDVLIYELKVALKQDADNRNAIGVNSIKQVLGIGVETGAAPENRKNENGEQRGNFGRGNHGHGNRGRGNYGNGQRQSMPDPIKQWFTVQLAKNSDVKIK